MDARDRTLVFALAVGLFCALVFGVIVLAGGDWLPGTIIVVSSAVALFVRLPAIRQAWRERHPPTPTA